MNIVYQRTEAPGSSGWKRTFFGLFCAPASAAVVAFLWYWPAMPTLELWGYVEVAVLVAFAGVYGWPFAFAVGWPAHMALRTLHWSNPLAYVCVGALLGPILVIAAECLLWLMLRSEYWEPLRINVPPPAIIGGAVAGLIFWIVRRPDRDITPKVST